MIDDSNAIQPYSQSALDRHHHLAAPHPHFPHHGGHHPGEDDLVSRSIDEYIEAFRRRKWFVAGCVLAGLAVGFGLTIPKPFHYRSVATIEVQGFNESFMGMNQVDPQASQGIYSANATNILTQVRVLNSYTLRRRVVEKLERETIPSLPPQGTGFVGAMNALRRMIHLMPNEPTAALREALESASLSVMTRAVPDTRVVEISCESTHPEVAAEYANSLVNEFIEEGLESRAKSSQRTNQWLINQLEQQKAKLEQSETRLKEFVTSAGVPGLTQENQQITLANSKLQQLQAELSAIQADRIARQSRYELAMSKGVAALQELPESRELSGLQASLVTLRSQLAEVLTTLTPEHYKAKRIQAQISEVESAYAEEKKHVLERLRTEYETALRKEKLLTSAYSSQSGAVVSQADKSLEYNLLKRDVDSNRQIYNTMVQQVNQAGIASAVPTNNIRVIDSANAAVSPSYRDLLISCGLGLTTGLLFGCVFAVVLQQRDRRVTLPGQLTSLLNVPELGVIPSDPHPERSKLALRVKMGKGSLSIKRERQPGGGMLEILPPDSRRIELVTHQEKPSPLAESFRATLVSIMYSRGGREQRLLSVTSPNPKEGKSTVTSNLGIALAELDRRVLLVDADMRKPKLSEVFGVPNTWGLSDILQESTPISQYPLESFVRATQIRGLYLLPSGPAARVVNNLLHSTRLRQLFDRLRKEFDNVLVDTPPMMLLPDARIIGQNTDAMILVFRAGVTSADDARAIGRRLHEDGSRVLGTVLNDWNPRSSSKDYYSKYYHHYYYAREDA
jgi:capsular exopolysaccharide synthesis family protein